MSRVCQPARVELRVVLQAGCADRHCGSAREDSAWRPDEGMTDRYGNEIPDFDGHPEEPEGSAEPEREPNDQTGSEGAKDSDPTNPRRRRQSASRQVRHRRCHHHRGHFSSQAPTDLPPGGAPRSGKRSCIAIRMKEEWRDNFGAQETIIVARRNNENIVMISIDEYNSLVETAHLLSTEANARHLAESIRQARLVYLIADGTVTVIACRFHY